MKYLTRKSGSRRGFTLVELLVVIVIIGILASLVVGLSGTAGRKMRESRTRAELTAIGTAIESYKAKFGHYPPDNPKDPALNSLYYELTGCLYSPTRKTFRDPQVGAVMELQTIKEHFGGTPLRTPRNHPPRLLRNPPLSPPQILLITPKFPKKTLNYGNVPLITLISPLLSLLF